MVLNIKISFHSYANKTNFHLKSFARSLVLIMRFTAARKWPIDGLHVTSWQPCRCTGEIRFLSCGNKLPFLCKLC